MHTTPGNAITIDHNSAQDIYATIVGRGPAEILSW